MTEHVDTIVVGGGQAGLAVSYYLSQHGREHVVLEQSDGPANAWRNHRWDSFTLNTPNWQTRMPGAEYQGDDPDGFMERDEVVSYLEQYVSRFRLPVRYLVAVASVEQNSRGDSYLVTTNRGVPSRARNVVVATGLYQKPKIPPLSSDLPPDVKQLHSDAYRSPRDLLPGAVLVVGSAQSGCQVAEELYQSGRKVYLAVGRAGRVPRRYRGKDTNWWSEQIGLYDRTADQLPSPRAKFFGKPHISGTHRGHTINLHQFARDGVVLLGHLRGVDGDRIVLAPDLKENLANADKFEGDFIKAVDDHVARTKMDVPAETLPSLRDGFDSEVFGSVSLKGAGIANVIWATSYSFDFSVVRLPILDGDGYPIQKRGMTSYPGLFFAGLPWLHNGRSGLLYGAKQDAAPIAEKIIADDRRLTSNDLKDSPPNSWLSHDFCCS
jgi:putative flavoprotein involved in K+ transport